MARTSSTMLELGTVAPPFRLPDTRGRPLSLDNLRAAYALLLIFNSHHCPYVKHLRGALAALARDHQCKGLACVCIISNVAEKFPDDSPAKMAEVVVSAGYI